MAEANVNVAGEFEIWEEKIAVFLFIILFPYWKYARFDVELLVDEVSLSDFRFTKQNVFHVFGLPIL